MFFLTVLFSQAALTKLSYVMSKSDWSLEEKRQKMLTNTNGEMTVLNLGLNPSVTESELSNEAQSSGAGELELIQAVAKTLHLRTSEELRGAEEVLYPAILCSAVFKGSIDTLDIMTRDYGADLAAFDYDKRTPLHVAASEGNKEVRLRLWSL